MYNKKKLNRIIQSNQSMETILQIITAIIK